VLRSSCACVTTDNFQLTTSHQSPWLIRDELASRLLPICVAPFPAEQRRVEIERLTSPVAIANSDREIRDRNPADGTLAAAPWTLWLTPARFTLLLALLLVATFFGVLFGTQTFAFRDYGIFGYPLAYYHRACFWRGELPLWNPLSNCGLPYLAQWNTLTLYPLALVYLLLPLPWSLSFFCLLHLFCAGMGMYFLASRWTNNSVAAAVAGMGFALNGLILNALMWPNNIVGLAWMPWVIWAMERAWSRGGRWLVGAALLGALQMLGGAPEIIGFTWLILLLLWTDATARGAVPRPLLVSRGFVVTALVLALAAVQLLPFLDLLAHSHRDQSFGAESWAMPMSGWFNLLLPLFHCYRSPMGVYFQSAQEWTSSYYPGVGVLWLAVLAGVLVRNRRVALLWALSVLSFVLALGEKGGLYAWLLQLAPVLGFMRFPIKFVVLLIFALPLLAAFGTAQLLERKRGNAGGARPWPTAIGACLLLLIAVGIGFSYAHPYSNLSFTTLWQNGLARAGFLFLIMGTVLGLARITEPRWRSGLGFLLPLLLGLDVLTHAPRQNPTVQPSVCQPGLLASQLEPKCAPGTSRAMMSERTHNALYRAMLPESSKDYLGRRLGLFGNCNLLDDIPTPHGFYSLYLPEAREIWGHLYLAPTNEVLGPLEDFLGIVHVTTNLFAWETRGSALPLATVGASPVFEEPNQIVGRLVEPGFDPRRMVYLPLSARASVTATNTSSAQIISSHFTPQRIALEITAPESALLVLAQTYYHPWRAYVNDKPVKIWRANHAFQALEVPPGRSKVRLVYEDKMLLGGGILSGLALLSCLLLLQPRGVFQPGGKSRENRNCF
jgi:hypothetical protein